MNDSKETIQQMEFDEFYRDEELLICKGIHIARLHKMSLSKFKSIITPNISTKNDEDQWTFDYESYLLAISLGYEDPLIWGFEFYRERWINHE